MSSSKDIVLKAENISKVFSKSANDKIKALDNVNFELKKGEILGVIGKNGSGKSTLLRVMSQITSPSSGRIEYEGVLASIIEIGTGFHHDFTGKENVYLAGSLLGMSKKEIKEVYDNIVEFSGLEEYMDTAVKHYSSGMYLRLAFAVSFHSKIDILLLDEVIAVGDFDFRKKCYQKIGELKSKGASIIFVSHNLNAIVESCDRCIILNAGVVEGIGEPLDMVNAYIELSNLNPNLAVHEKQAKQDQETPDINILTDLKDHSTEFVKYNSFEILPNGQSDQTKINMEDEIHLKLIFEKLVDVDSFEVLFYLTNASGVRVLMDSYALRKEYAANRGDVAKGNYTVECVIPGSLLNRGVYTVGMILCRSTKEVNEIDELARIKITTSAERLFQKEIGSIIRPELDWKINEVNQK